MVKVVKVLSGLVMRERPMKKEGSAKCLNKWLDSGF